MFPIVPTHQMSSSTVRHHRGGASGPTSLNAATTGASTSDRHHPIWNMWNATLMDYKPARPSKRPAKTQLTENTENETGCVAATDIPRDVHSEHLTVMNRSTGQTTTKQPLRIGLNSRGVLCCDPDEEHPEANTNWITFLQLADDVHSNNIIAEIHTTVGGRKELRVRAVRTINAGDSLLLWFSEDIVAMMNIPFLTPACIRGKNAYTCLTCDETFENPNPLKIHMATSCNRRSLFELWMRVEHSINKDNLVASAMTTASLPFFPGPLSGSPPLIPNTPPPHQLSSWLTQHQFHLQNQQRALLLQHHHQQQQQFLTLPVDTSFPSIRPNNPSARLSAFQAVAAKHAPELPSNSSPSRSSPMTQFSFPHMTPIVPFQAHDQSHPHRFPHHPHHHLLQTDSTDANTAAAHLETIVSNMGTAGTALKPGGSSAGGHLCIYCGKVYSRKYGLKIHIRTHTGFKPLKCKYCLRPFGDPSNLNKHVRLHVQGSTIYKCPEPQCDKILVRRRDLQRHMQTRHSSIMLDDGGGDVVRSEDDQSDAERDAKRRRCGSSSPSSVASSSFDVHEESLSTDDEDHLIKVDQ